MRTAFDKTNEYLGIDQPTDDYIEWLTVLNEDVIQSEFGYEPGEFTVYPTHWAQPYEEGLSPRDAWQRSIDVSSDERRRRETERAENYARIVAKDANLGAQ